MGKEINTSDELRQWLGVATRPRLEEYAASIGVEDPKGYANMEKLRNEIHRVFVEVETAHAAEPDPTPVDPQALVEQLNQTGVLRDPRVDSMVDILVPLFEKLLGNAGMLKYRAEVLGKLVKLKEDAARSEEKTEGQEN